MEDKVTHSIALDFNIIFQAMPGLVIVLSPEFEILAANKKYRESIHKGHQELVGKNLFEVFPSENTYSYQDKDALRISLQHVVTHKVQHAIPMTRYDIPPANGEGKSQAKRYWNLVNTPVLSASGDLLYIIHEVRNITEQVQEEEHVKTSHDSLRLMAKIVGGAVWEYDILNKKFTWSESYKNLFGYSDKDLEVEPEDWSFRVHPDDIVSVRDAINSVISKQGKSWTGEYRYKRADGTYADVLDHGYILYDLTGNPVRMLGSMIDVSKQKEYERELQQSNERFELVAKATNDVIWDWDLLNNSIWWNDGFKELFGYKDVESTTSVEVWMEYIHPEDAPLIEASIQKAINSGDSWEGTYRFRCADGTYKLINDKGYLIRDSSGLAVRMLGAMLDITEKHEIERKIQESNRRTQFLAETIPQIVWSADSDGNTDYFNQRWYEYTHLSEAEALAKGWSSIIHPDDLQFANGNWQHAVKTGEKYEIELRLLNDLSGEYRWFLARALPMRNDHGHITKWFGTATDIHDFKLLHQQLKESNKQFRFLAEAIPQMVWTTNSEGRVDYFNQRWIDYTHLSLEKSMGIVWSNLLHPDDQQRALDRWQHSLNTGAYYEVEYRIKNGSDGSYRWFLAQGMPMRTKSGKILKWFGTCTDIEDHKRAEEELLEKNLELERINQDLDSFVYTASHDLKLPIVNMGGIFRELMESAEFRDPEAPAMIHMFNKSLKQLHETIHDLSEVVRVQKQKDRDLKPVDLYELLNDVNVSLQEVLRETGARIHANFSEAPAITFTRSSLKSIFYNLINNAIKYRSQDRIPEIHISTQYKGNFIELRVEDNGIGIDMNKHQNKLFQMFKRFHNHVAGSGLGLYIVNRLLTNQGGYIHIDSTLDKGTTFYLYFKI